MARRKKDRLGVVGLASTVFKNLAQQRSMSKSRHAHNEEPAEKVPRPKDTRTPEEIRVAVDLTRERLVSTVDAIKFDLDVPARTRDLRDRVAAGLPDSWKGEPRAAIIAGSLFAVGLGVIAGLVRALHAR